MIKLYFATAMDKNPQKAKELKEYFEKLFKEYPNIQVFGAGFNNSPVLNVLHSTWSLQRAIAALDLRQIRECDIFLFVTDAKTYAAGSLMELEYSRQMGLMTVVLILGATECYNIFLQTLTDRLLYSVDDLKDLLVELNVI
jgi:hypothetical protein